MIEIAGRRIGRSEPPYLIAEIGSNHDGDLARAKELIQLAAEAGAHAAKFQHFAAATLVSRRGLGEVSRLANQESWPDGIYETYEAASTPVTWMPELARTCDRHGVACLTTAYSPEILDAVDPYVAAHKIGSGDITHLAYLRRAAKKGKPILLATGASGSTDVLRALTDGIWRENPNAEVVLLQCNANYDGGEENFRHLNLAVLDTWRSRFPAEIGLSDHTPGHVAPVVATALGATVIEKHFTDDRSRPGPDHAFAMTPDDWREMVVAVGRARGILGDGQKRVAENERDAVVATRRALRYARSMAIGEIVTVADVLATRPCPLDALPAYEMENVLGRRLRRPVEFDTAIVREDLA